MNASRQRFLAALNSQQPDFQSGFEKGMSGMTALLSGAGHIGAQGIVGADQGASSRHYPPQPLVSPQVIQTLDDLMAEAQTHLERFSL